MSFITGSIRHPRPFKWLGVIFWRGTFTCMAETFGDFALFASYLRSWDRDAPLIGGVSDRSAELTEAACSRKKQGVGRRRHVMCTCHCFDSVAPSTKAISAPSRARSGIFLWRWHCGGGQVHLGECVCSRYRRTFYCIGLLPMPSTQR